MFSVSTRVQIKKNGVYYIFYTNKHIIQHCIQASIEYLVFFLVLQYANGDGAVKYESDKGYLASRIINGTNILISQNFNS